MSEAVKATPTSYSVDQVLGCNLIIEDIEEPKSQGLLVDTSDPAVSDYKVARVIKVGNGYDKGTQHNMPFEEGMIIVYAGNSRSLNFGEISVEMIGSNGVVAIISEIQQS